MSAETVPGRACGRAGFSVFEHMTSMRNCYDDCYYLNKSYALTRLCVGDAIAYDDATTLYAVACRMEQISM